MAVARGRWVLPTVALIAGVTGTAAWMSGSAADARITAKMTPLERLLIQDDIRQRIGLYGLYTDGDGPGGRPRDLHALAYTLMTPDVVSEIHPANAPSFLLTGREVVAKTPREIDPDRAHRIAGRHYLLSTVFDRVTPTEVITRTPAVYFDATKNPVGPTCKPAKDGDCGGTPVKTIMWIYEMHWRKTAEGWQIARNILRDDN